MQSIGLEKNSAQGVVAAYTDTIRTDDRQSAAKLETTVKRAAAQKAEIEADLTVAKMELEASLEASYAALQSATAKTVEAARARYEKAVKIAQAKLDAARLKAKNKAATINDSIVEIAENLHQNTVQKQQQSATMQATDRVVGNEGGGETPTKPYSMSRPKYGRTQVNDVWNAHANPETGTVTDPSGATIVWDRTKPRNGQWDMGHIPGQKYSNNHEKYMNGEISLDEFLEWYRNPQNYRPELPQTNRSHLYEDNWPYLK